MDIEQSEVQNAALQNFTGQLSAIVMRANLTAEAFEESWLYLRHLPQMQPFASSPIEDRLSAAIHHFGGMDMFSVEPCDSYMSKDEPDEIFYIGYTDSLFPDHPLVIDGYKKHRGHIRWALETAIYMLLHRVGCYDINDTECYCDEDGEEFLIPSMPDFRDRERSFDICAARQDELGDWLRTVKLVADNFSFQSIRCYADEMTEADALFPIVYKHPAAAYEHIEMWRQSGWPYNPCGQYYVTTNRKLIVDMPKINPEKYLMKIFQFNLETLSYEL